MLGMIFAIRKHVFNNEKSESLLLFFVHSATLYHRRSKDQETSNLVFQ